jgi:hypothetical protein
MYNFADSSVTASAFTSGANTALTLVATTAGLTTTAALVIYYDDQLASTTVTVSSLPAISGTVTANTGDVSSLIGLGYTSIGAFFENESISIAPLPTGTSRIGVVTIGGGTVTIGAGTSQIGSVTASISNFPATQAVSLTTLPALVAGTAQIGSVTASISGTVTANNPNLSSNNDAGDQPVLRTGVYAYDYTNNYQVGVAIVDSAPGGPALNISGTVDIGSAIPSGSNQIGTVTANTFAVQGTAVTTSNFTSTTASTVLANYNATREVLTIFNEGAGNLHICAGATCTTIAYQVRLSAGDYYEVPNHQTTITHSAVFATAGTARVCQVS